MAEVAKNLRCFSKISWKIYKPCIYSALEGKNIGMMRVTEGRLQCNIQQYKELFTKKAASAVRPQPCGHLECLKSLFSAFSYKHQTANAKKQNSSWFGYKLKTICTFNLPMVTSLIEHTADPRPPFDSCRIEVFFCKGRLAISFSKTIFDILSY